MSENIELEQVRIEGMIVEMRRLPFGVDIVRRELNRRDVLHLDVIGNDDDPAGVLTRASFNAGTA
ncbi:hypothetical protein D3C77_662990 [compost metagenome]